MNDDDDHFPDLALHPVPDDYEEFSSSLHMPNLDGSKWQRVGYRQKGSRQTMWRRRFVPARDL